MSSFLDGDKSIVRRMYITNSKTEKTFKYDKSLPFLPIPDLSDTLNKYLNSIKPFCTLKEFEKSKIVVADFKTGIGKNLQEQLLSRSRLKDNWLEEWWFKYAYLMYRDPLVPLTNMSGPQSLHHTVWEPGEDKIVQYTSLGLYTVLQFYTTLRDETLAPQTAATGEHLSMHQFHLEFNTVRIPDKNIDYLESYFKTRVEGDCPQHVIFFCNGHIWLVDPWKEEGVPLTPPELEFQVEYIRSMSLSIPEGPGVGALTCDNRDQWAENRQWLISLSEKNKRNLSLIEKAILTFSFDESEPKDLSEVCWRVLSGNSANRWADKSYGAVGFKNGYLGCSNDHSPYDAMVNVILGHFQHGIITDEMNGVWNGSLEIDIKRRPTKLEFDLDHILLNEIERVKKKSYELAQSVGMTFYTFEHFGKGEIKEYKIHPDAFIQCAMQLAYFSMHNRLAPTYETAMTRQFKSARTETVRSCTPLMADWIKIMSSDEELISVKRSKLIELCRSHMEMMRECQKAQGIDRHLLGLYITALESGSPIHDLFTNEAFVKSGGGGNFTLSSSTVGYTHVIGGVAPMVPDGYGVFYTILPNSLLFVFSNFNNGSTCLKGYENAITNSLLRMKQLLDSPSSNL